MILEPGTESPSQETRGQDHVTEGRGQNIESRAHGIGGQGPEIGGQGQETGSRGLRTADPGQRTGNQDTGLGPGTNLGTEGTDQGGSFSFGSQPYTSFFQVQREEEGEEKGQIEIQRQAS